MVLRVVARKLSSPTFSSYFLVVQAQTCSLDFNTRPFHILWEHRDIILFPAENACRSGD